MDHGRRDRRGREGRDPDKDTAPMHPVRARSPCAPGRTDQLEEDDGRAIASKRRRRGEENGIRGTHGTASRLTERNGARAARERESS
jgi:trimethylamine:corrinoid methyltransferase-like protein